MMSKRNYPWPVCSFLAVLVPTVLFQIMPPKPLALYATAQTTASGRQPRPLPGLSDRHAVRLAGSANGAAVRNSTESDALIFTFFPSVWYDTGGNTAGGTQHGLKQEI